MAVSRIVQQFVAELSEILLMNIGDLEDLEGCDCFAGLCNLGSGWFSWHPVAG